MTKIHKEHLKIVKNHCKATNQSVKTFFRKELNYFNSKNVDDIMKGTKSMSHKSMCKLLQVASDRDSK